MPQVLSSIKIPSSTRAGKLSRIQILLSINLSITGDFDFLYIYYYFSAFLFYDYGMFDVTIDTLQFLNPTRTINFKEHNFVLDLI